MLPSTSLCYGVDNVDNVALLSLLLLIFCRAFHHYREARGQQKPLKKHPELDRLLREEYHSLDDFRAKEKAVHMSDSSSCSNGGLQ